MGRAAPQTSKRSILCIYSTSIGTEYFKHALYSPFFFSLQNAVCFITLTCLVPVLFTSYIQGVLKLKKNYSDAKRVNCFIHSIRCNILGDLNYFIHSIRSLLLQVHNILPSQIAIWCCLLQFHASCRHTVAALSSSPSSLPAYKYSNIT